MNIDLLVIFLSLISMSLERWAGMRVFLAEVGRLLHLHEKIPNNHLTLACYNQPVSRNKIVRHIHKRQDLARPVNYFLYLVNLGRTIFYFDYIM